MVVVVAPPPPPPNGNGGGGGGGGGGSTTSGPTGQGAAGGSGTVIVKWDAVNLYNDMTLVSNAQTAQDGAPTKGDLVVTLE